MSSPQPTPLPVADDKIWTPALISLVAILGACAAAFVVYIVIYYSLRVNRWWRRRKEPKFIKMSTSSTSSQKEMANSILPLHHPRTLQVPNKLRKDCPTPLSTVSPYSSFDDTSSLIKRAKIGNSSSGQYLHMLSTPPRTSSLASDVLNSYPFDPSYYNRYSPILSPKHHSRNSSRTDLPSIVEEDPPEVPPLPVLAEPLPTPPSTSTPPPATLPPSTTLPPIDTTIPALDETPVSAKEKPQESEDPSSQRYSWTPADTDLESQYAPSRPTSAKSSRKSRPSSPVSPIDVPPLPSAMPLNTISDPGPERSCSGNR